MPRDRQTQIEMAIKAATFLSSRAISTLKFASLHQPIRKFAMRSRFLSTDYYSSRSPYETLAHFEPLSLPSSLLPSSDPPFAPDGRFFDLNPDFNLSTDVDAFPIEKALGEFLSDVVPRFVEFRDEDRGALEESRSGGDQMELSEKFADAIYEDWEKEMNSTSGSASSGVELWKGLQFEIVELDIPMKCVSSQRGKKAGIRFEVPDTDVPLDMINIEDGIAIAYPHALAKSICAMANIPEMFSDDQDSVAVKNGCCSPSGKIKHPMKLPCFELNEVGLELHPKLYVEEAFDVVLSKIELYHALGDELVVNAKEILGPNNVDILEQFLGRAPCELTEQKQMTLNPALDVDLVDLNNDLLLEKDSAIYPIMQDGDCAHVQCSVQYHEVEILDSPSHIQMFVRLPTAEVLEVSEQMFKEDMEPMQTLYESVVSSELALVDDTFKSLPEPVPRDEKMIRPLTATVGEILDAIKPHPFSASDRIYLDWHPLLDGPCNREMCLSYMIMIDEIISYEATSKPQAPRNIVLPIDLDLLDDSAENSDKWQCGKVLSELHDAVPQQSVPCAMVAHSAHVKNGFHCTKSEGQFSRLNGGPVSSLFESTSQYNDLNYFLDARRGAKSCQDKLMKIAAGRATSSAVHFEEPSGTHALHQVNHEEWVIELHEVKLSDQILGILDHMQKIYLDILENCTDLSNKLSPLGNGFELTRLPKQKLLEFICEKLATTFTSGQEDESTIASMALYSIKQSAYYLCFFGVDVAHLYLNNLVKKNNSLTVALRSVKDVIENACWKAGIGLTESHPSLPLIQEILRSHTSLDGDKILIIAERLFWLPLNRKLASIRIRCQEVRDARTLANQPNNLDSSGFTTFVLEALQHSQCLLISHEHVSASFPFNKFGIILEYGGSCTSCSISSLRAHEKDLPKLHFLKVETDNDSSLKAFCEGVDVPQNRKPMMDRISQFTPSSQRSMNIQHIVGLLNWVPIEENKGCTSSYSADQRDGCDANESIMSLPNSVKSKHTDSSTPFSPDIVVVINTQSFKKMLFSRRSSYQKILALEKAGAQVVEREIDFPLDLICSASVCLVWYEVTTLGDIRREAEETPSTAMFMENIATNVLMSLSFAFSGCIMIFEGDSGFLAALMESSDALYAAAASLGMNIQLFCSYMAETTDEIILSCIRNAARLNRSLYPAMPETETIAESFLTRFPSINPLSAHAILSSGGVLMEFFESSHEHRIQAIEKFHISDESIYLFSVLCRYGELGESKSVMTECSSIDSESSSGKLQSEGKKNKVAVSSHILNRDVENPSYSKRLKRSNEEIEEHARSSQLYWSRNFSMDTEVLCQNRRIRSHVMDNERSAIGRREYINEDLRDEVIDHDSTFSGKRFSQVPATINFLRKSKAKIQSPDRSSLPNCVAFGTGYRTASPTSSEVNCAADDWAFLKVQNQDWEDKVCDRLTLDWKEATPSVQDRGYQNDKFRQCSRNMPGPSVKANVLPLYSGNVRPETTQSCSSQQDRNSTMELLQRVKEKRKTHQQNLQGNRCLSCPASLKNKGKSFISRSPSIIDSYRCQGGSQKKKIKQNWNKGIRTQVDSNDKDKMDSLLVTPKWTTGSQMKKTIKQSRSKETRAQLNSNYVEKRDTLLITPTWTPMDKRARQNLSFARNGNEKQSKLVWRSRNSPNVGCSMRKRYRQEG